MIFCLATDVNTDVIQELIAADVCGNRACMHDNTHRNLPNESFCVGINRQLKNNIQLRLQTSGINVKKLSNYTIGLLKQLNTRLFKVILIIPLAYWCIKTSELYKYGTITSGKSPMFGGSQDHDGNNYKRRKQF